MLPHGAPIARRTPSKGVNATTTTLGTTAVPVLRLARAADRVRLARTRAIALPDLADRDDEIGDLTRSLEAMTATLSKALCSCGKARIRQPRWTVSMRWCSA